MREYSKYIAVAGTLAALTVPSVAMASAPSGTTCAAAGTPGHMYDGTPTTDITGTVPSNLTVPAGAPICRVFGTINGNTSVGGTLLAFGGAFNGNVSVAGTFQANTNVKVNGNLSFLDPAAYSQSGFWNGGNEVTGNLSYMIDSNASYGCYAWPALYLHSVKVDKNFAYTGYTFNSHLDMEGGLATPNGSQTVTSVPPQPGC
jgi:hypothetical protein